MNEIYREKLFTSPFITKLSKYKKQLELFRKLQVKNPDKIVHQENKLAQGKPSLILLEKSVTNTEEDTSQNHKNVIVLLEKNDGISEHQSDEPLDVVEETTQQKKIDNEIEKVEEVKAKSRNKQQNEYEKIRQEKVQMQQFLTDFVLSVKNGKDNM